MLLSFQIDTSGDGQQLVVRLRQIPAWKYKEANVLNFLDHTDLKGRRESSAN